MGSSTHGSLFAKNQAAWVRIQEFVCNKAEGRISKRKVFSFVFLKDPFEIRPFALLPTS